MTYRNLLIAGTLVVAALSCLFPATAQQSNWKDVENAMNEGLPKTAIEELGPIIERAVSEKSYAEAIKAIGMRAVLQSNLEGNKPEEKITRMETEIAAAPDPMKPAMHAIVANWYWHYFQQNRWRFLQRTETAESPSDDLTTWSLPRILHEIDTQFRNSLEDAATLQRIPVSEYEELLEKGNAPASYRPTLFDVLAHEALDFYSSGERAVALPQDAFELTASSPIFSSRDDFVSWNPKATGNPEATGNHEATGDDSLDLRAIRLLQALIEFHSDDDDPSALLDADLRRLNFGADKASGEDKSSRYRAALRGFAEQHRDHPISARALHHLASDIHADGDWVDAREIAKQGQQRFPDSVGGRRCFNLIQQIEARSAQATAERVWNRPRPTIDVRYRNVDKVFFRLVPFDFEAMIESARWHPVQLNQIQKRELLRRPATKSWSADLPPTEDFQERLERLETPEDLPAGSYFLIASHNQNFDDSENQVSFCEVWVSNLALVTRDRVGAGFVEGFVLDAVSGNPIEGALVRPWKRTNRNEPVALASMQTDEQGMFRIRGDNGQNLLILASHRGQSLSSARYLTLHRLERRQRIDLQTRFFTDRALYRPGQTIRYKGICISVDQDKDDYQTVPSRDVTVVFSDPNGKEIERVQHRTNAYGSFSGSVTAPTGRLNGRMTIRVDGEPSGQTQINVEEYKRPKFKVELEPPKTASKLSDQVIISGKATAYTGVAINDAKVSWRVVREVRYPDWWYWRCWWLPPSPGERQEIADGVATTDARGQFELDFVADPDPSVPRESEPTFRFTIYADVTDTTGETRSDQIEINVGYTALSAKLSAASWLTEDEPVEIQIETSTLDGEPQAARGTIKVYTLEEPESVARSPLSGPRYVGAETDREPDLSNPNAWPLDEIVFETEFETDGGGSATQPVRLPAGLYRATLETSDRFGNVVNALLPLQVLDPDAGDLDLKVPDLLAAPTWTLQPGETLTAVWGSGYETARAFVELEHRGRLLQSFWTDPKRTQIEIDQAIDESMRGGLTLRTTMVRENRAYLHSQPINVPWTNKQLTLKWEHFVSKLKPAEQETWTAVINGPNVEGRVAEMVATLYDASLDAYRNHAWPSGFGVFRTDVSHLRSSFENTPVQLNTIFHSWSVPSRDGSLTYWHFPEVLMANRGGYGAVDSMQMMQRGAPMALESAAFFSAAEAPAPGAVAAKGGSVDDVDEPAPDLSSVSPRKNLNETAFFFPHLVSDQQGTVRLEFRMPEALTEWKFLGYAHDQQLRSGLLTGSTVTAKDLMVQPNPPRFLREGDEIEFTVKVSNQSPTAQNGQVRLTFADARTGDAVDDQLGNVDRDQPFELAAGDSKSFAWRLNVPDGMGLLTYKAVGASDRISDGEEGFLPVLSRKILVTESVPLPIRGEQTKQFEFEKLLKSSESDSLEHQALTVQVVSNPSWYAVLALPYLMEYPYQCTEQTFNRLYANSLAQHIAQSDPRIEQVFDQWRATPALDSPLAMNQELKSVMLEETPWLNQAQSETQARRNVGILFDGVRLADESERLLAELADAQLPSGAWPWFPGGRENDFITLYITTGFGRLRHLGVDMDTSAALKSLQHLDAWADRLYRQIKPERSDQNHLSATIGLYLYGRSFFLQDQPVSAEHSEAVRYWIGQAKQHWLALANRQSQAHLALALKRFGDEATPRAIMRSIEERSIRDEELGMFWRDQERSWWWYRAPIETQAVMIEAFDEVMNDQAAVEDCKTWLIKQKQTQDWKTTKATSDAVYALLLRGSNLLASDDLVEVTLGSETIAPTDVEAGTGFYEKRFVGSEIEPRLGDIKLEKNDPGTAWASIHWQYLEDMGKISAHQGTPLELTKRLYVKKYTADGPTLLEVDGPIEVGDELVVRIVLKSDRDMEYLHLKDYRGSGTEPVNVLSGYRFQDGLAYYESTRDAASHFFIDYLPKGTYVFEYSTRVQLRGDYQTGIATIECMYAPEFNSHSESLELQVRQ